MKSSRITRAFRVTFWTTNAHCVNMLWCTLTASPLLIARPLSDTVAADSEIYVMQALSGG